MRGGHAPDQSQRKVNIKLPSPSGRRGGHSPGHSKRQLSTLWSALHRNQFPKPVAKTPGKSGIFASRRRDDGKERYGEDLSGNG